MGRYWRELVAVLVGVALRAGGCTAAAHLGALQLSSAPSFSPRSASVPQSRSLPRCLRALPPATAVQRGIDVDFYTYPGPDAAAAVTVGCVRSLHANAIAISFPCLMTSRDPAGAHAGAATHRWPAHRRHHRRIYEGQLLRQPACADRRLRRRRAAGGRLPAAATATGDGLE
jgi:hypothetical protein